MDVKRLKGFRDILPSETPLWRQIESTAQEIFSRYGFEEIRLPLLEETGLFRRSIGEATDIVEKEMYTFSDMGGSSVTLRPEGTASAVRAYLENGLHTAGTKTRIYYAGPMFRRERPQKGRLRQFHQIGAECFGWSEPGADADLLCLVWDLFGAFQLTQRVSLEVNSLGCSDDRTRYVARLRAHLEEKRESLCENCRRRIDVNPLRVIDCKSPHCREATADVPDMTGDLCDDCAEHFGQVRRLLSLHGIPYSVNPRMVRGLDYYNRTTFELLTGDLGAQNAVAAGGRYDGLVQSLGGPSVPALGFALGVERLSMLLGTDAVPRPKPLAVLVHQGRGALDAALGLRRELLTQGVAADIDFEARSFKAQIRSTDRLGARFAVIVGENEVESGSATLKDLSQGSQETLPREEVVARILQFQRGDSGT